MLNLTIRVARGDETSGSVCYTAPMNGLTIFGACAVTVMLLSYALERRSSWWVLIFTLACVASSLYGWLAGTWPFGVVEGVWAVVAFRRWYKLRVESRDRR